MEDTTGKVINCRAAILWAQNEDLSIENIEVAPPKANEVRVKMVATGICQSDAYYIKHGGFSNAGVFPAILGHEGSGIVESIGEGVTRFKKGDHVIPLWLPQCNECDICKSKIANYCLKNAIEQVKGVLADGTSRFTCKGKTVHHFMSTSTFSEYTVVDEISLCKIDDKAPLNKVCVIGCCIPTGYGAATVAANVRPGSSCAVWGLGAVGLATVMGCKNAGATRIIGVDVNPGKFEMAKQFGCTEFFNPKDHDRPTQQVLAELTNGGLDFTFECCGNVETMRAALESTRLGWGTSVVVGIAPKGQEIKTMPMQLIVGKTWKGTICGGFKSHEGIPQLVDSYMKKEIMVDEFITHTMSLDKINEGFQFLKEGKSIRSVVIF